MENNVEERKVILQELYDFIQSSQSVLENTLQALGWDESKLNTVSTKPTFIN